MGGANNICSDKTGTLTKNKMTWTQIWCGNDFRIKETSGLESINLNNYVPIIRLINNKTKEVYSICIKYQLEDNFSKELICKTFDLYLSII